MFRYLVYSPETNSALCFPGLGYGVSSFPPGKSPFFFSSFLLPFFSECSSDKSPTSGRWPPQDNLCGRKFKGCHQVLSRDGLPLLLSLEVLPPPPLYRGSFFQERFFEANRRKLHGHRSPLRREEI